ncbi:uncharacterized protein LOC123544113 [Mercenaria mercenaria]|uniref:uncharacterized protein LOC123544113 n=1 Tax=Mercenaria mercenaria TaxID=6596 RepID=UPI00234F8F6C|nr:uncharacterized protein LOC123544113 [Mercenaria mercenaria]
MLDRFCFNTFNTKVDKMAGLQGLSKEVFKTAFDKVTLQGLSDEWEIKLLTHDMQDAAILFMKENFVPHEPLIQIFGVQWNEGAEQYWKAVFEQRVTLVLTSKVSGEIIAIRGIEIVSKTDRISTEKISDERLRNLLEYLNYCDDQAKFFEYYRTDEAIHFSGLAVAKLYRRRGIATLLLRCAVDMVENLGLEHVYIKGEASSDYSKKIYEKLDFETLYEQIYEEYDITGKQIKNKIGEHKSNKVYGKCIKRFKCADGI